MDQNKPTGQFDRGPLPFAGEPNADYRARIALHQAEISERRQRELVEQSSLANTPSERIRIWERLHQVKLPVSSAHSLVEVIAADTGLSADEVRDEQRQRLAPAAIAPAPVAAPSA